MSYNKNDPETIRAMFNSIAKNYDRTNAVLSFQMHKRWNEVLIQEAIVPASPKVLLDLCCGTGAIAFRYLHLVAFPLKTYMLDFSEGMLKYARQHAEEMKINRHEITYLHADAQKIPLLENSVDCVTIAYGIRNVKQPHLCINDVYRVLRSNGYFGILELTQPKHPIIKLGHRLYLTTILPVIGKFLTSNREAYNYLCDSINSFIPPENLERLMKDAGFKAIKRKSLMGGIATILIGQK